ncbi:MAG: hypothetical protein K8S87_03385 [Planctomycetes bacterium]|nr:hypothetical protein [Planctomycetota bacterium]
MKNNINRISFMPVILLILAFIALISGCSSSIEIVESEKPVLPEASRSAVSEELSKECKLGSIEFTDVAEEKAFFFALQLYVAQEYYRAVTEFMRFVSYFDDSSLIPVVHFFVGECYRAAGNYPNAVFFYVKAKDFGTKSSQSYNLEQLADFNIVLCLIFQEKYEQAKSQILNLTEKSDSTIDKNEKIMNFLGRYLNLVLLVAEKKYFEAASMITEFKPQKLVETTGLKLYADDLHKFEDLSTRNVALSVIMSTMVPGLGQLYTGRVLEALTSILLTGVFSYIAYEAFSENQEVLGAVSSFLAASFYLANIYNSANSAISFNENRKIEFYNRLMNKLDSDILHLFLMPEESDSKISFTFAVIR